MLLIATILSRSMCKAYGDCLRCGYRSFDVEAIGSQELSGQRPQSTLEELTKHALSAFTMCYSPFDKAFQKHCGKLCPVDFIETSDTIAQALIVAPGGHDLLVVGQKHLSATSDNVSYVRFALLFCLVFVGSR